MAQKNVKNRVETKRTHEGAPAKRIDAEMQLRRSVLSCLLWEDQFYEDGESIAKRIADGVANVDEQIVLDLAREARTRFNLRHVPLLLLREAVRNGAKIADALADAIQRPDELTEFLALYWGETKEVEKNFDVNRYPWGPQTVKEIEYTYTKTPLAAQVKKGLAKAFTKFDEYQLAKYNRDTTVKLRDVLFLTHPKAKDAEQQEMWDRLVEGNLKAPDTWENRLSGGEDKKEAFEILLRENKLGALALLRNLRNMVQANVDRDLVTEGLVRMKTDRILPFRFIAAEKYAPSFSADIENAMLRSLREHNKFNGKTIILVDHSGSMVGSKVSEKSELDRLDAASALAILVREISDARVFKFSERVEEVPNRRGFALRDALTSGYHGGTKIGDAVKKMNEIGYDRLIVFTDEQSHDRVPDPVGKAYMVNVASYENGVGYGKWNHIDGFSEAIIDYIFEYEKEFA